VTGPSGSASSLPDGSGQTATWAFAPTAQGLYVIRGTLSGGGGTRDVLSHFTIWAPPGDGSDAGVPPAAKNAVPFAPGELESPDRRTLLEWPTGTFGDAVVVQIAPQQEGSVSNLPAGQTDGWFGDSDGTIHVLTRHLTYYAVVGPEAGTKLAMRIITVRRLWLHDRSFIAVRMSLTAPARVTGSFVASDGSVVPGQAIRTPTRHAGVTILRIPLRVTKPGLYRLQMHADGAGQLVNRTALIRFLPKRPASPVWQDARPLRIAVVDGVKGLAPLGDRLGRGYLVRRVADSALYTVVDTKFSTAAAAVVVDLRTVPVSTLATLHALLPEVKIVGLTGSPVRKLFYRANGVSAVLPRTASAATVARTIRSLLRRG